MRPIASRIAAHPPRNRRLLVESLEDRRLLATAVADLYLVQPGQTLSVGGLGVLSNDNITFDAVDNADGPVEGPGSFADFSVLTQPEHGTFTQTNYTLDPLDGGGHDEDGHYIEPSQWLGLTFDYTPDPDFRGLDYFTYSVEDYGDGNTG